MWELLEAERLLNEEGSGGNPFNRIIEAWVAHEVGELFSVLGRYHCRKE